MKILAIDTCNAILSTAIADDNIILNCIIDYEISKQAEKLILTVDKVLSATNMKLHDIDYIAVSIGPGSFTGVRIGLSAVLGFNIATNIPIIAISCLEALAYKYTIYCPKITVAMDARKDSIYTQNFDNYQPITEPSLASLENIDVNICNDNHIIVGESAEKLKSIINVKSEIFSCIIDASMVAKAAYIKIANNISMNEIAPLYLREACIKKP